MGLIEMDSNNNYQLVTIQGGKFAIRLPDNSDHPKAERRKLEAGDNIGKEICELRYPGIEGKIESCKIEEMQYGENFIINLIDDEGSRFKVQLSMASSFWKTFVKSVPNMSVDIPITLRLGLDKEKNKNFMWITQAGETVRSFYTKDNPNGIPEPKKRPNGKFDWADRDDFLYEKAMEFCDSFTPMEETDVPF
jgi:hypothetical protein